MSVALREFVVGSREVANHFARNVPRPPVPGEENETQLASGGIMSNSSTRSSGSYRSHISGHSLSSSRSNSSGKSHTSSKSRSSARSRSSTGTASTPQKSKHDQTIVSDSNHVTEHEDCQAPLGFEPEGSAALHQLSSVAFVENSPQPAYLRWAENLESLLIDRDGVRLFRRFLEEERDSALLSFLFACKGLGMVPDNDKQHLINLVRTIYRTYIKGNRLGLQSDIKSTIVDRIRRCDVDCSVFSEAVFAVEDLLRNDAYPAFLKSDVYLTYIQLGGSGSADSSGGSSDDAVHREAIPLSHGALATVLEEQELKDVGYQCMPLALTEAALAATQKLRDSAALARGDRYVGFSSGVSRKSVVNPYHVSYAPVSAQDSELQSLSSDAPTDDTATSHTTDSSSADGENCSKSSWKRNYRLMRRSVSANQQTSLNHPFIPRTEVMPRDRNLAEKEPTKFAALLTERLQKVKHDRDTVEKVMQSINESEDVKKPPAPTLSRSSTTLPSYPLNYVLFPSGVDVEIDLDEMIGAQNILEEHVSRVWNDRAMHENDVGGRTRTTSARLPAKPFHRQLLQQPIHPSPDVSSSGLNYPFGRLPSRLPATSSFCRPDFDVSCCSEVDCSIDNDRSLTSLPQTGSAMSRHRMIHSTPKSKSHVLSKHVASQSDSEMWDDCGSSVEQRSGNQLWSSSVECSGCSTCQPRYSSQPNLPAAVATHTESRQLHKRPTTQSSELIGNDDSMSSRDLSDSMSSRDLSVYDQSHGFLRHASSNMLSARPCRPHGTVFLRSKTFSERLGPPPRDTDEQNDVLDLSNIKSADKLHSSRLANDYHQKASAETADQPTMSQNVIVVGFYLGDEAIPYRTTVEGHSVTLGRFKQLISKRGNYRYFFKKASDEFGSGVVMEEVTDDGDVLPLWEGKIIAKVERTL